MQESLDLRGTGLVHLPIQDLLLWIHSWHGMLRSVQRMSLPYTMHKTRPKYTWHILSSQQVTSQLFTLMGEMSICLI